MKKLLCLLYLAVFFSSPLSAEMLRIDPQKMAEAEIDSWKAYYSKDRIGLIRSISKMISLQYEINDSYKWNAVVFHFGMAVYRFSTVVKSSSNAVYQKEVLPSLSKAYEELKTATQSTWNANTVARLDLEWWIERRLAETHDPEIVGHTMVKLYQEVYGKHDQFHFSRAGYLRATAARYRDLCKMRWSSVSDVDWKIMQDMLVSSYEELVAGIDANTSR